MRGEIQEISVCILFFEKVDQTIECIRSFIPSKVPIVILNNGSSKNSLEILKNYIKDFPQIKVLDSEKNLGVSGGRNFLISHTTYQWLFFVDNDIVMKTPNWLNKIQQQIISNTDADVFIPILYNVHEKLFNDYSRLLRIVGQEVTYDTETINNTVNWFPGGASIINPRIFDKIGLYDEKMFVGGEDFELCIRAIKSGIQIKAYLINDIELIHNHRSTKNEKDKNAVAVRYDSNYLEKSSLRITEKHNVFFKEDWNQWSDRQRKILAGTKKPPITMIWRRIIPSPIKKILNSLLYSRVVPISCSLFLTFSCNFKCTICRRNVKTFENRKNMELHVIKKILEMYPTLRYFTLAGFGEPTLCPKFPDIVDFLRANHKYVGIITNGSNIGPFRRLKSIPNSISISLYGPDSASYINNTGCDMFDDVISNFRELKSKFENVGFSFVITKTNYLELEKILSLCDKLEPEFFDFQNCLPFGSGNIKQTMNTITQEDKKIIQYIENVSANRKYIRQKPIYIDLNHPRFACRSHNYIINLDGDGNIGGCQRQIPPDPVFGNIFSDANPFRSRKMEEIRKMIKKKDYPFDECHYCFGNFE